MLSCRSGGEGSARNVTNKDQTGAPCAPNYRRGNMKSHPVWRRASSLEAASSRLCWHGSQAFSRAVLLIHPRAKSSLSRLILFLSETAHYWMESQFGPEWAGRMSTSSLAPRRDWRVEEAETQTSQSNERQTMKTTNLKRTVSVLTLKSALAAATLALLVATLPAQAAGRNPNPGISPAGSTPYGHSYGEWG